MSRLFAKGPLLVFVLLFGVAPMFGQKPAETSLGFNAEKVYDFTNVDSVNLYNGNVLLTIPLGLRYQVSPVISYQFVLTYNSMVWDYSEWDDTNLGGDTFINYQAFPNLRSNAGVGWRLSLGRLFGPTDYSQVTIGQKFVYEGPAGDDHPFESIYPDISHSNDPSVAITDDPTPLRLRKISNTERWVEFPSGEIHRFQVLNDQWRLTEIDDRATGNWVKIVYSFDPSVPQRETRWTVSDSLNRQHVVDFQYFAALVDSTNRGGTVARLTTVGVGSANLVYDFGYTQTSITRACGDDGTPSGQHPLSYTLPMLTSLTLQANSTQYGFEYYATGTSDAMYCEQGTLKKVIYPTRGTSSYKYRVYSHGGDICNYSDDPRPSPGLGVRTVNDGVSGDQDWTYIQMLGNAAPIQFFTPSDPCYPLPQRPPHGPAYWSRTSVLSPPDPNDVNHKRTRVDHYFDVFGGYEFHGTPSDPFTKDPRYSTWYYSGVYGVPPETYKGLDLNYGSDVSAADSSGVRVLKTRMYSGCTTDGDCSNGILERSVYEEPLKGALLSPLPQYTAPPKRAPVPRSTRTVYNADTGCGGACYVDVVDSDPDNAGHYRVSTISSNFAAETVTTTTGYKVWTDNDLFNVPTPFILNTYTDRTTSTASGTARQQFCFDSGTGFLLRQRTMAGPSAGTSDVINVFTKTSRGDVELSSVYGGDAQSVNTDADLCNLGLPTTPQYKTKSYYTTAAGLYTGGILTSSETYKTATNTPLGFKSADRTIDVPSGLVTADADPAGATASYAYKSWGSLQSATSPGGATTTYTYTNASGSAGSGFSPMKIDAVTSSSVNTLRAQFVLDGLGRPIRQSHLGPDGNWSAIQTAYDGQGRKYSVSEPESTGATAPAGSLTATLKTTTSHDAFGRPLSVEVPDGSVTTYGYTGVRETTKTLSIFTGGASPTSATSKYTYDGLGRLLEVEEPSGPTTSAAPVGGTVTTSYGYDIGGRLSSVAMKAADGVLQNRLFSYDGRGFLQWEVHPESGMTTYSYDAQGNVLTRRQSAAGTLFDLDYDYDDAGRLLHVKGRNPNYNPASNDDYIKNEFRPIKEFTYANGNDTTVTPTDRRAGKLTQAIRYNYPPSGTPDSHNILSWLVRVKESYKYADVAGRKTHRTTDIETWDPTTVGPWTGYESVNQDVTYNDLDLPQKITYPTCVNCGMPPYAPERDLMPTYSAGQINSIPDFVLSTSYWPNGMRNQLVHWNLVADTQTPDGRTADQKASLPRPASFSSGLYDACLAPVITSQPDGGQITASTPSVNMTVTVATNASLAYQWYSRAFNASQWTAIGGATTASYSAAPSVTTSYYVAVSNSCRSVSSRTATVSTGACVNPSISADSPTVGGDSRVRLSCTAGGTEPYTIIWYRLPDNAEVGRGAVVTTANAITATTSYYAKISNLCSATVGTSQTVTAVIPLPMPSSGLVATKSTGNQIQITWPAVTGAGRYHLERRSHSAWVDLTQGSTYTSTSYTDNAVTANTTYAYRVWASADSNDTSRSGYSNVDVATVMTFNAINYQAVVAVNDLNQLLTAVNAVRYAAGWEPVAWDTILGPGQALPNISVQIKGAHILALRGRMNDALQALGAPIGAYTDSDPALKVIRAIHMTELQERAQ